MRLRRSAGWSQPVSADSSPGRGHPCGRRLDGRHLGVARQCPDKTSQSQAHPRRKLQPEELPRPHLQGPQRGHRRRQLPFIACTDAGCTYPPEWLARICAPLIAGTAEYALGGACLDPADSTLWDWPRRPFWASGYRNPRPASPVLPAPWPLPKTYGSASAASRRLFSLEKTPFSTWKRGGWLCPPLSSAPRLYIALKIPSSRPAASLAAMPSATAFSAFVPRASSATPPAASCTPGLLSLPWTVLPLLAVLALQIWYAYHPDWRLLSRNGLRAILARFLFSVLVPWIIVIHRIRGTLTKRSPANRQNL